MVIGSGMVFPAFIVVSGKNFVYFTTVAPNVSDDAVAPLATTPPFPSALGRLAISPGVALVVICPLSVTTVFNSGTLTTFVAGRDEITIGFSWLLLGTYAATCFNVLCTSIFATVAAVCFSIRYRTNRAPPVTTACLSAILATVAATGATTATASPPSGSAQNSVQAHIIAIVCIFTFGSRSGMT